MPTPNTLSTLDEFAAFFVKPSPSLPAMPDRPLSALISNDLEMIERLKKLGELLRQRLDTHSRVSLATEVLLQRTSVLLSTVYSVRNEAFGIDAAAFAAKQMIAALEHELDQLIEKHSEEDGSQYGSMGTTMQGMLEHAEASLRELEGLKKSITERITKNSGGRDQRLSLHAERAEMNIYGWKVLRKDKAKKGWCDVTRELAGIADGAVIAEFIKANAREMADLEIDEVAAVTLEQLHYAESGISQATATVNSTRRALTAQDVARATEKRRIKFLRDTVVEHKLQLSRQGQAFDSRHAGLVERQLQLLAELHSSYRALRLSALAAYGYNELPVVDLSDGVAQARTENRLTEIHRAVTALASYLDERASRSYEIDVRVPFELKASGQLWEAELEPHKLFPPADHVLLRGVTCEANSANRLELYFPDRWARDITVPELCSVQPPPTRNPVPIHLAARETQPCRREDYVAENVLWNHSGRGRFLVIAPVSITGALWFRCACTITGKVQST